MFDTSHSRLNEPAVARDAAAILRGSPEALDAQEGTCSKPARQLRPDRSLESPPQLAAELGPELLHAAAALHRLLAESAARDAAVRDGLAALGQWLVHLADEGRRNDGIAPGPIQTDDSAGTRSIGAGVNGHGPPPADEPRPRTEKPDPPTGTTDTGPNGTSRSISTIPERPLRSPASGIVPLRLGDSVAEIAVRGNTHELIAATRAAAAQTSTETDDLGTSFADGPEPDLAKIARHSAFKARACRWSAERRRRILSNAVFEVAIKPTDARMIDEGRALECFAWTLDAYAKLPPDDALEQLACLHENLAAAAQLADELKESTDPAADGLRDDAYQLLAEAQSALRKSLLDIGQSDRDQDQDQAFLWLRRRTEEDRIFVKRYMRLTDPADPGSWADLRARISAMEAGVRRTLDAARTRRKAFSKLRYLCEKMESWPEDDRLRQWKTLAATVETLIQEGVNPSDRELRERLLPLVDSVPDSVDAGPGFTAALRSIDRFVADLEASGDAPARERTPTPEVREAAQLLRGRVVVLIGGERRRHAAAALEEALELAELRWIGTIDHQSIAPFETEVARDDVALVLVPIRWANHSFQGIQEFCRRYGRPFVRLPAGYNPNRVALEVLRQAGDALRGSPPPLSPQGEGAAQRRERAGR